MKIKYLLYPIAMIVGGVSLSTSTSAATVVYNDKAAFQAAAGATTTYGFETHGVVEGDDLLSPVPASQLDNNFDLAHTNLNAISIEDNAAAPGVVDGTHYLFTHSVAPPFASDYTLTFSNFSGSNNEITAFGLTITDFASFLTEEDGPVTITYDTGTMTGTLLSILGGQPPFTQNFVGLTVDSVDAFTSITLTMNDNLSGFQDFDEVIYSQATSVPVPESDTSMLAFLGLGLGAIKFRKQPNN